ncbi:hypothetical protein GCM10010269_14500 [Streptomyces humidus]|uniref:Zinc-finger domain-containing protein n=1 Tax=Streptomyces humidus TaxID=52259 RepID=A0A918FT14_9ACTN|nr:hypothetical protein [Streptomyces humidus]GGR76417.1 hypothetical protein GCM10010269_14500 [Streptomyces humidus]
MAERPALRHIPHAELVSRALDGAGAPWGAAAARHLGLCRACRERLALYERAVAAGRLSRAGETLHTPPTRVWTAIRAQLAADRPRTPPSPPPAAPRAVRRALACARRGRKAVARAVVRLLARLRPGPPRGSSR